MSEVEKTKDVEKEILRVIEEEIRPALARDGGDVEFGSFENGIVRLGLRGACQGCGQRGHFALRISATNRY